MGRRTFPSAVAAGKEAAAVLGSRRALADVYLRGRLSGREREHIMVAVSRVIACSGCTFVHERWALRAGATDDELRALQRGELTRLDGRSRAGVAYAMARAEAQFDDASRAAAPSALTARDVAAVDAVARAMTFANLTVNTAEASWVRLRRLAHRRTGTPPTG